MSSSDSGSTNSVLAQVRTQCEHLEQCRVTLRRATGHEMHVWSIHVQPDPVGPTEQQAEAIFNAYHAVLDKRIGAAGSVVGETLFYRDLFGDRQCVRAVRDRMLSALPTERCITPVELGQPPVDPQVALELQANVLVPTRQSCITQTLERSSTCSCDTCTRSRGLALTIGEHCRVYTGPLFGAGDSAAEQTKDMFGTAEHMLQQAGLTFRDVVRTWIYLSDMERDYPELNLARREFFRARDISPPPASTGIGASLVSKEHRLCMAVYAASPEGTRTLMTTPTLNEAPHYGADFSRGMRLTDAHTDALFVSGTASLNEVGESVHHNDVEAQVTRMLLNVSTLLDAQGATFADVICATTYIKNTRHADQVRALLQQSGYHGFPHALVEAKVCRPELLCETEALAVVTPQR